MLNELLSTTVMRTSRLTLSRPEPDDIDAIHTILSDPEVWRHLPSSRHASRAETELLLASWIDGWERHGTGVGIVRRRGGSEVLGYVGCSVRHDAFWNLSYRLAPRAQGQGFAKEAAAASIAYARELRPDLPVIAYMLEHNTASVVLAISLGLTPVDRGPDSGVDDGPAIRVVYADTRLTEEQRALAMS